LIKACAKLHFSSAVMQLVNPNFTTRAGLLETDCLYSKVHSELVHPPKTNNKKIVEHVEIVFCPTQSNGNS